MDLRTLPVPETSLPHRSQHRDPRFEAPQRPRSQPPPGVPLPSWKRSANHVKPKPANPQVISSIIAQLETLAPPVLHPNEYYAAGAPERPFSANSSHFAPSPSIPYAQPMPAMTGLDLQFGGGGSDDEDDDGMSDAALPPTIRTSRPPLGLSSYFALRSPSFTGSGGSRDCLSVGSKRSSVSSGARETRTSSMNRHLSAESWVVPKSTSQESLETTMSRNSRKDLRRKNSQQTLRAANFIPVPYVNGRMSPKPERQEFVLLSDTVKTPSPKTSPKQRLYLDDGSINEEVSLSESQNPLMSSSDVTDSLNRAGKRTVQDRDSGSPASKPSPISDSIPLRTSSIRQSTSPVPRKKDQNLKRQTVASSVVSTVTESTDAESWADLGEDDGTVKRIKELQRQREIRLRESNLDSMPNGIPTVVPNIAIPAWPLTSDWRSEDTKRTSSSYPRPHPYRASTEPRSKAHRILGLTNKDLLTERDGNRSTSISPDYARWPRYSNEEKRPVTTHRPTTAGSTQTPRLSLEYSYAAAVNILQGEDRELSSNKRHSGSTAQPARNSLFLKGWDLQSVKSDNTPTAQSYAPARSNSQTRSITRKPSTHQDRRTTFQPDLPLDFDKKKSRRKSMSDARNIRILEGDGAVLERRKSIEDAVTHYLNAPRLNRTVLHPQSGRVISYSEVGDPEGAAVFICVGMGLTRFVTAFYDELATTLRLRLITIDRPGVGGSQPYPPGDKSGPLNWPDDVLAICQEFGITKFSILAHSAGAIYALATALIMPQWIRGKVHLLAPWIPPSQLETINHAASSAPPAGALPRSQRLLRALPTPFLKAANSSFMSASSAYLKPAIKRRILAVNQRQSSESPHRRPRTGDPPPDARRESIMLMDQYMPTTNPMEHYPIPIREEGDDEAPTALSLSATATPTDPNFTFAATALNAAEHAARARHADYTSRLTQRTWELATRDSNPAVDLLVCLERHRDVGFRYVDVAREVVVTHGSADKRVPVENVRWLGEQINRRALAAGAWESQTELARRGCEVRVLEGEGHGLMASARIMGDCLTEIAGYAVGEVRGRLVVH